MNTLRNGYSADVQIRLIVGSHALDVASCHSDGCLLRETIDAPPGEAELVIAIDGHERREHVYLAHGLSTSSRDVAFVRATSAHSAN
jgi:hypothetical protein